MLNFLQSRRGNIEVDLRNSPKKMFFSPASLSHFRITLPLIKKYASGRVIDLGCGMMPYKPFLPMAVEQYDTLDFPPRVEGVTYQADLQNMNIVPSSSYDTAFCFEVLEHIPDTDRALKEIWRVMRPGAKLIFSVPHLSRLHEEPNDYYRFTRHGLAFLLKTHGFQELVCIHGGGLFSLIGHQISTILLSIAWGIPVIQTIVWVLNEWLITRLCVFIDQLIDPNGILALGYSVVAEKIEN